MALESFKKDNINNQISERDSITENFKILLEIEQGILVDEILIKTYIENIQQEVKKFINFLKYEKREYIINYLKGLFINLLYSNECYENYNNILKKAVEQISYQRNQLLIIMKYLKKALLEKDYKNIYTLYLALCMLDAIDEEKEKYIDIENMRLNCMASHIFYSPNKKTPDTFAVGKELTNKILSKIKN